MKIKTETLQSMVDRASKCVSNNKLIPLTSLMNIKVEEGILTLTTTDATNYFYVSSKDKLDCEDFEVSVLADLFIRLVLKTTSEYIELNLEPSALKIKGNGNYSMELILDENGSNVKFPVKYDEKEFRKNLGIIKLTTVNNILNYNKASLAVGLSVPSLSCYYCGNSVITSDRLKICANKIKIFDEPKLLTPRLMDILSIMSSENIMITGSDDDLVFCTDEEKLYSPITAGVETFPVNAINNLVDSEFPSNCKISRITVTEVLDRLSLFVNHYDEKKINLVFTNDGVSFSNQKSSGVEIVPYAESNNFKEFNCCIDLELLRSQIATQNGDTLDLSYGSDVAIKLVSGDVTEIVALVHE